MPLQGLPEIGTEVPVGCGGGISLGSAIGIPLTAAEPRITAAIFGGGFVVYEKLIEAARRIITSSWPASRPSPDVPGAPAGRCGLLPLG